MRIVFAFARSDEAAVRAVRVETCESSGYVQYNRLTNIHQGIGQVILRSILLNNIIVIIIPLLPLHGLKKATSKCWSSVVREFSSSLVEFRTLSGSFRTDSGGFSTIAFLPTTGFSGSLDDLDESIPTVYGIDSNCILSNYAQYM